MSDRRYNKPQEFRRDIFESNVEEFQFADDQSERERYLRKIKWDIKNFSDEFENPRKFDGRYLFHRLAEEVGRLEIVKLILKFTNVDINCKDIHESKTALHYASAVADNFEVVKFLIEKGAKANIKDKAGQAPLHIAAAGGHLEIVNELLKAGAQVDATRNDGWNALLLATNLLASKPKDNLTVTSTIEVAATNVVRALVKSNANVNMALEDGTTALHLAALFDAPDIIRILTEKSVEVTQLHDNLRTALHLASEECCERSLEQLIAYKQGLNLGDLHKWTVLHMEAMSGNEKSVRKLLNCKADQHKQDGDGWTPLDSAVFFGDERTIQALLSAALTKEVKHALDVAKDCEKSEAVMLMLKAKVKESSI